MQALPTKGKHGFNVFGCYMAMTRRLSWLLLLSIFVSAIEAKPSSPPARLMPGLGKVYHPVSTKSPEAQQFFDQGLELVYGFNHDEARKAFQRAAELDPKLAMAWWGVALTLGPNYNLPVDPEREKAGYEAVQKAVALKENSTELERAYIEALAVRYSDDAKPDLHALDVAYKDAMATLAARYPDDLDAATLYAESMMNINPWKLWTADGKPAAGTNEIVATLESVLKRDPDHLGANHYYIHAVEASPNPERALPSAARLEKMAPAEGHLTHMPAHIYARVGDHAASARCNVLAAAADKKYIGDTHVQGVYPLMYYSHNLHFLAYADCMRGNFSEAKSAADELVANVMPGVKEMPMLEGFLPTPMIVLFAFERWNDLAKLTKPDASLKITTAVWHSLRGVAFASLGKTGDAEKEQKAFHDTTAQIPPDTMYDQLNTTAQVFKVHEHVLAAAIALSRHAEKSTIASLQDAVAAEDALNYSEPPAWYPPVRPTLGRALLAAKQVEDAEKVFRADLKRNPRNARALTGLRDCLKAQKRSYEADEVDRQFKEVWKVAATEKPVAKP
jgi:tetratricopeptide (TPR) repeat protein